MVKEKFKKFLDNRKLLIVIVLAVVLVSLFMLILFNKGEKSLNDTISYQGKTYVYLEYNTDIFTYSYNNVNNTYFEEDVIYPVSHDKFDVIYSSGDLFVLDSQVDEAKRYYSDDNNYKWSIAIDKDDSEIVFPISISEEELKYIYDMDNMTRSETVVFDDIESFGSIVKTSKDQFVYALISLAYYDGSWYWKTEVIDDSKENDPEYVIKLPDSLNDKINKLLVE